TAAAAGAAADALDSITSGGLDSATSAAGSAAEALDNTTSSARAAADAVTGVGASADQSRGLLGGLSDTADSLWDKLTAGGTGMGRLGDFAGAAAGKMAKLGGAAAGVVGIGGVGTVLYKGLDR